jgi:hypothetical protein
VLLATALGVLARGLGGVLRVEADLRGVVLRRLLDVGGARLGGLDDRGTCSDAWAASDMGQRRRRSAASAPGAAAGGTPAWAASS